MLAKVNYKDAIAPLVLGLLIWLATPVRPAAITTEAWYLFAIFVATIVACITKPLPMPATTLIAVTLGMVLKIFKTQEVTAALGNTTAWLVAMCLFMSAGFINSGIWQTHRVSLRAQLWSKNVRVGLLAFRSGNLDGDCHS